MLQQMAASCPGNAQAEQSSKPVMRLADFIEQHMPVILASWDTFAVSLLPAAVRAAAAGASSGVNAEGTSMGLGLFIVRQVAQAHGGTVLVDSAHGRTTFTVVLPRGPHPAT